MLWQIGSANLSMCLHQVCYLYSTFRSLWWCLVHGIGWDWMWLCCIRCVSPCLGENMIAFLESQKHKKRVLESDAKKLGIWKPTIASYLCCSCISPLLAKPASSSSPHQLIELGMIDLGLGITNLGWAWMIIGNLLKSIWLGMVSGFFNQSFVLNFVFLNFAEFWPPLLCYLSMVPFHFAEFCVFFSLLFFFFLGLRNVFLF